MTKLRFLKNMRLSSRRSKFLGIAVFALLIFIPALVFGDALNGYKSSKYGGSNTIPVFHYADNSLSSVNPVGTCIQNTSGSDYFIPTRKLSEWNSFMNGRPAGVTPVACCGDGVCSGSETYSNCPSDCTAPVACTYWWYSEYSSCDYLQSRQAIVSLPFYCSGGSFTRNCVNGGASGCASGYRCVNTTSFIGSGCSAGSGVLTYSQSVCVTTYIPNGCSNYYNNNQDYSIDFQDATGCSYLP